MGHSLRFTCGIAWFPSGRIQTHLAVDPLPDNLISGCSARTSVDEASVRLIPPYKSVLAPTNSDKNRRLTDESMIPTIIAIVRWNYARRVGAVPSCKFRFDFFGRIKAIFSALEVRQELLKYGHGENRM